MYKVLQNVLNIFYEVRIMFSTRELINYSVDHGYKNIVWDIAIVVVLDDCICIRIP